MKTMFDLFQTADSDSCRGSLAYYQEREWRITRIFGAGVRCRRLTIEKNGGEAELPVWVQNLRGRLQTLDGEFFTAERLNGSAVLHGTRDETFFDLVEDTVCPEDAAEDVEKLLGGRGFRPVDRRGGLVVFSSSK